VTGGKAGASGATGGKPGGTAGGGGKKEQPVDDFQAKLLELKKKFKD